MTASARVLREGLAGPLARTGVDLEDVQVQQAGRREIVRIIVDRDGGIDLDSIASISRLISEHLEVAPLSDEFIDTFVLEVSSPGVDRPLTEAKHWRRAIKRKVDLLKKDGTGIQGRIAAADDDAVVITLGSQEAISVPMAEIARGMIEVEFTAYAEDVLDQVIFDEEEVE